MTFLQRLRAAVKLVANRYEGAQWSSRRSWLQGSVMSARFDADKAQRIELVRKARYFEKNNPTLQRLIDLWECYTVGTGLVVTPSTSNSEWNVRAKSSWDKWCQFPDISSRQPFGVLQGLISRSWFVDGEIFILKTKGEQGFPRVQLLECHLVDSPPGNKDESLVDGVLTNSNGRPLRYYVGEEKKPGQVQNFRAIPAEQIIHVFEPSRAGQIRGMPFTHATINALHDLDDLQLLEMDAAKDQARTSKIIKTATGEIDDETIFRSPNSGPDSDDGKTRNQYYEDIFGSGAKILKTGDEYQHIAGTRPSQATKEYWRTLTEMVCAGVGIPYILVYPDSIQGTVFRGALDVASAFFRSRSAVMADVCRRIYQFVIQQSLTLDSTLKGAPPDWYSCSIQPPRAINVDVGRNSAAMLAELEAGATNYELVYSPLGLDWREELRKKAEQVAYINELATKYNVQASLIAASKTATMEQKPTDEDDDPLANSK